MNDWIQIIITIFGYATFFMLGYIHARRGIIKRGNDLLDMVKPWMSATLKNNPEVMLKIGGLLDASGYLIGSHKGLPKGYEYKEIQDDSVSANP